MVDKTNWDAFWTETTPEMEIQMRDFYGGRQWILKHTPRVGKVVEAGCGLARYVFYLSRLGIDIDGIDFHEDSVERARTWARDNGFDCEFNVADVLQLPYESDSVSGYLSFGVVEHFIEGPEKAIREAHRVLRPGGIAVITTPSVSFSQVYLRLASRMKGLVKSAIGMPGKKSEFFQYWYTPGRLASFVQDSGLKVVLSGGGDFLYSAWELGLLPRDNLFFRMLTRCEDGFLSRFGAQSFTVSVKEGPLMFCFLCGEKSVERERLSRFYLPICRNCEESPLAEHYRHARKPRFNDAWQYETELLPRTRRTCNYCRSGFWTDEVFEDFGFSVPVCGECLRRPELNLELSNRFLKPLWREHR
jgi:SAM-dependent methyltransferase